MMWLTLMCLISDSSWCAGLSSCLLKRQGEKNNGNSPDDASEKKVATEIQTASNISSLVLQIGSCLSLTKIAADWILCTGSSSIHISYKRNACYCFVLEPGLNINQTIEKNGLHMEVLLLISFYNYMSFARQKSKWFEVLYSLLNSNIQLESYTDLVLQCVLIPEDSQAVNGLL